MDSFDSCVKMWVYEEMIDGKKLTEIINTTHENVKYLPGKKLPENVVCCCSFNYYYYFIVLESHLFLFIIKLHNTLINFLPKIIIDNNRYSI